MVRSARSAPPAPATASSVASAYGSTRPPWMFGTTLRCDGKDGGRSDKAGRHDCLTLVRESTTRSHLNFRGAEDGAGVGGGISGSSRRSPLLRAARLHDGVRRRRLDRCRRGEGHSELSLGQTASVNNRRRGDESRVKMTCLVKLTSRSRREPCTTAHPMLWE